MQWWQTNPIYQIYPRSFKDSNGDGVGDLKGIIEKLDYLEWLGIKTVWISPIYKSPMIDFGYDISDYRDIDPLFGNMKDFEELANAIHQKGMKLVMDFVPNHTSDQHEWFRASKASEEPYTDYYVWRDGAIDAKTGEKTPPNSVMSVFGGPAWSWCEERQKWYLHHFLNEQPNLNYSNPSVRREMKEILKFWVDKGVDGFRVDAVVFIGKEEKHTDPPPADELADEKRSAKTDEHSETFQVRQSPTASYEIVSEWIRYLTETFEKSTGDIDGDGSAESRHIFVCTEGYTDLDSVLKYYDHGVDFPFNFSLVNWTKKSTAKDLRRWVNEWMKRMADSNDGHQDEKKRKHHRHNADDGKSDDGRWPNWVASNHDQSRPCSRLGGSKYANVLNTLLLTLPGTPTLYQGDELGMLDVPVTFEQCRDPYGKRFGPDHYARYTRDPCRSPMIWEGEKADGGFCSATAAVGTDPWLPLHKDKQTYAVDRQRSDPSSYLNFFRRLLQFRQTERALYAAGHNIRVLAEDDDRYFVYERWAPEAIDTSSSSDYLIILNVSQSDDEENGTTKATELDLTRDSDLADRSATVYMKSMAPITTANEDGDQGYEEGQRIDLSKVRMKPADVLIIKLGDEEGSMEPSKKRKIE